MVSEQLDRPSLRFFKSFGLRLLKKLCSRSCKYAGYFASDAYQAKQRAGCTMHTYDQIPSKTPMRFGSTKVVQMQLS